MAIKMKITVFVAVIGLVAVGAFFLIDGQVRAAEEKYSVSTSPLFHFRNADDSLVEGFPEVTGSASTLVRTRDGLAMTLRTSGLEPKVAYTVWWVIFNNPEACSPPGCGEDDLLIFGGAPEVDSSVLYAAGNIISDSGTGDFGAYLEPGEPEGQVLFGSGVVDPMKAEVNLVVRNHGPARSTMIGKQLTTFAGGCSNAPAEFGTQGEYACYDPQASVHLPPVAGRK